MNCRSTSVKLFPPEHGKGGVGLDAEPGNALFNRLADHADSVRAAENLRIQDFFCRYLVVDDIWIPLGESLLIGKFSPIWNAVIDGFGNHDPGSGRYQGLRPVWDVLHPGRVWAARCKARPETAEQIGAQLAGFLKKQGTLKKPNLLAQS